MMTNDNLKELLLNELKCYFGNDKKRIDHAYEVLKFGEELLLAEKADPRIVIPCCILHDVGIKAAEEKYGSSAGHYQEKEGPPIARTMLLKTDLPAEDIEQICGIIGNHHSPGKIDTNNFRVVYDADCLVNIKEVINKKTGEQLSSIIEKMFLTTAGKSTAVRIYL